MTDQKTCNQSRRMDGIWDRPLSDRRWSQRGNLRTRAESGHLRIDLGTIAQLLASDRTKEPYPAPKVQGRP